MENAKQAYEEIIKVLNKHKDLVAYDIKELESKAKLHLFGLKLVEEYGLKLDSKDIRSLDYNRFGDYRSIGLWGEKYRRIISWLDDGEQPEDELLLAIGFPTGAYIFGDDYPVEIFQEFWKELKTYQPKYCDSHNNGMYFSMDNASKIFNDFNTILSKYNEKNREDAKARKIKKMRHELAKLENN